jgi:hypothetical protein
VDAARYRELAARSLGRLRADYPITPRGQLVAPGLATDRIASAKVLEGYVGAPSMGGLALAFLNQALDQPGASLDGAASTLASDIDTEAVIGDTVGSFGVARRGHLWYAVRASRMRAGRLGTDVRYDLGLVGLKRFENGAWRDLVAHRPNTMSQPRIDSIGPVRVGGGPRIYPAAPATVQTTGTGGFLLRGGFWVNKNKRARRADFRYEPTKCGVAMTFPGRPREVYEMSYFFRDRPAKHGREVIGKQERVRASVPLSFRIQNHYASSMHAPLFRVRVRVKMPGSGRITLESC